MLEGRDVPAPQDAFVMGRVYWADVLQAHQRELRKILDIAHAPKEASPDEPLWRRLVKRATETLRREESRLIAEFIGDIIGYRNESTRRAIYQTFPLALLGLKQQLPEGRKKAPLTIISHSLGTVISSDYVWDAAKARHREGRRGFHRHWRLDNFFTLGSPMALFALQYGGAKAFNQPIVLESAAGRWVNVFDTNDPVSMPLRPLNAAYRRTVLADAEVDAGPYLLAHTRYFLNDTTIRIISRKLALDWCVGQRRLPAATLRRLAADYDATLGA